ncbi:MULTISPECIES: peroxiredoxin [Asticcacaulis]|uniref:peroxiredoxin n=1 Tax=Asticcacaulis TaxID=76890 RepID=UPI001FD8F81C|nr:MULTISPECIES: peroxiredoxin [Asticcacaulis]MBP2158838.1 peroxiredoxin [Asticcacaulis solisilvae]MDR6799884.1 peroxiredoxin [Asticcacaulis sp. BE141]
MMSVKRTFTTLIAATFVLAAGSAFAGLPEGAKAPDFTLQAALAGKPTTFTLKNALKKGPVVLYFFPAAFTAGCTLESHKFAEANDDFNKLGATVVGVTAGNVDRVAEFSKTECRDKFAVAADPGAKVAAQYQSTMEGKQISDRTSYVIAPSGKILLSYTDRNPEAHITKTMEAVRTYKAKKG